MPQKPYMGAGALQKIHCMQSRDAYSTSLMLLAVLHNHHPQALTTYDMGLWVLDTQNPPRPISIVVKTLAQDGYVQRMASAGKRSAIWGLTPRGLKSISKRLNEIHQAAGWIALNPNISKLEKLILNRLLIQNTLTPQAIAEQTSYTASPIRTAIKKLRQRDLIANALLTHGGISLTKTGKAVALHQQQAAVVRAA